MEWRCELKVNAWNDEDRRKSITLGVDLDGDLGIIDPSGYSIIIHRDEVELIREWLTKVFRLPPYQKSSGCAGVAQGPKIEAQTTTNDKEDEL